MREIGNKFYEVRIIPIEFHNMTKFFCVLGNEINVKDNDGKVENWELIGQAFASSKQHYQISVLNKIPGEFTPRVYRPVLHGIGVGMNVIRYSQNSQEIVNHRSRFDYYGNNESVINSSVQQLAILTRKLESIFNTVHPVENNLTAYGHEIRNLLILASTEVEAQFRGILMGNDIQPLSKKFNRIDFNRLFSVLRLQTYSVKLAYFPDLPVVSPFKNWTLEGSERVDSWYDDYNAVKHDRESNMSRATLLSALEATTALCVLLLAQYGWNIPYWNERVSSFFELTSSPAWEFDDCYLPPIQQMPWESKKLVL